jgi:PAS domain S-box-containing protein
MSGTDRDPVGWTELAEAVPGGVAVQSGDTLVYVSETLASMVGVAPETLRGEHWRTLFDEREAAWFEREPLAGVRSGQSWEGTVRVGGETVEERSLAVQLSRTDSGSVLWVVTEDSRASDQSVPPAERIVETVDDGVYVLDAELRFTYVNDALCEMVGRPRSALLGTPATAFLGEAETIAADEIRRRVVEGETDTGTVTGTLETPDGERILEAHYRLYPEATAEYRGSIGVVRDVTEREARERKLERQRDEFATLSRINDLLLETIQALVQTTSRDAIERTITRRLTDSDLYALAWVGEPELDGDRIVPRTHAGTERGYLADIALPGEDGISGDGPAGRAVRTGDVQVANVGDPVFEPWRDRAVTRGLESLLAVPLQHGETVYGALAVYATREDAFTERERTWFDALGRTVGFAIHAAKNRELLFADSVVELEFDVTGSDTMLVETADELGCRLTLDGYVAAGERWVLYVDVEAADPRAVVEAVAGTDRLEQGRVLGEAGRVELTVSRSKLLDTVTAAGASLRRVEIGPDNADLLLEAPVSVDVRELVSRLQAAFPETALLSRREPDHDARRSSRPDDLLGDLTARQREALEAAFHAGYFDWPRETTAEAVAESLDLAPPTLHGHLRKAEQTILSGILED